MARCLAMQPKDIQALLEIPLTELKQLKWAIDNSTINYDSSDPEQKEAVEYVVNDLLPFIGELIKDSDNGS